MERVRLDDVDNVYSPAAVKRPLSRALEAAEVSVNYYELTPGDAFGFGYHRHEAQEEVFLVEDGTVTFETADGDVAVGPGEVVRFAPGEFQRGVNEGTDRVRAVAIGAPRQGGDVEMLRDCPDCGERTRQAIERPDEGEGLLTTCVDCGAVTGRFVHGEVDDGGR